MTTSFLITGASGTVGNAILDHLQADPQQPIYKATHQKAPLTAKDRWVDFEQPNSFEPALQGIDVVFLLHPRNWLM